MHPASLSGRSRPQTVSDLRAAFDVPAPLTVGLEEEIFLCDPETLAPAPVAPQVVARAGDPRIRLELPAAQVELVTRPHVTVAEAIAELTELRRLLVDATRGLAVPMAAPVHPTAPADGELNAHGRYGEIGAEYQWVARRQVVGALQVHVAVGDADRTLAVYNALRLRLPELAALAACAPFYEGRDTGLASVRPLIAAMLPRQNVPPAIASWEAWAQELEWGERAGTGTWWWELRPHRSFGTLELRVPDTQPTIEMAAAVAGVAHAVVSHLAEHANADDAPTWRIEENRWSAVRHGVEGTMADLETGAPQPTRERLLRLISDVEAHAPGGLDGARALVERNGAMLLREQGLERATRWLTDRFTG